MLRAATRTPQTDSNLQFDGVISVDAIAVNEKKQVVCSPRILDAVHEIIFGFVEGVRRRPLAVRSCGEGHRIIRPSPRQGLRPLRRRATSADRNGPPPSRRSALRWAYRRGRS